MSRKIRQTIRLKGSPRQVFEALTDSRKTRAFTGSPAFVNKREGAQFSNYNGYCRGRNLEVVKNKLLIQAWRARDWDKGHYSIVTIRLSKTDTGTRLEFTQENAPAGFTKEDWTEWYWEPLKEYMKAQANKPRRRLKRAA